VLTEQHWRMMWEQGSWGSALSAARTAQGRIFDLLIAHNIDPNQAYRDRAIEELKNLINWSTWVDPSSGDIPADVCTAEAAVAATVGLDWLWDDLSEADRLRVLKAIRTKAIAPYRQGVEQQCFWYNCYHSWNAVVNSGCGLAAMALSDEEPSAREAYRAARIGLKYFFDTLGREGGWDEGIGYWGYAMRYVLLFGEAVSRSLDDQKIFHSRGMEMTGLFPVYFTPRGQAVNFGDNTSAPLDGTFYLLVQHYGLREMTWWLDTYGFHRDASSTGWSTAGLAMLFRPIDAEVPAVPDLLPLKLFHEIGWAAIADKWPRPGTYVAVKTGDLAASHSQRDMNSIQLQVDGEMILTDLGSAKYSKDYLGASRGSFYEVQARAHNTAIFGERDHQIDAQGEILEAQSADDYRWVACDAGQACGENVHFVRHLILIVQPNIQAGRMLIVLDELGSAQEKVELFWHTLGKIEPNATATGGIISAGQVKLEFATACTAKYAAGTGSRELAPNRTDRFLHITVPGVSKAYFASVFSREKLTAKLDLKVHNGAVKLKVGGATLQFKGLKQHLQLESVDS
jgi:hypothetical protein